MTHFLNPPPHPPSPRRIMARSARAVGAMDNSIEADTLRESPQRPTARRASFAEQSVRLGAALQGGKDHEAPCPICLALGCSPQARITPHPAGTVMANVGRELCQRGLFPAVRISRVIRPAPSITGPLEPIQHPLTRSFGRNLPRPCIAGNRGDFTFGRVFMGFYLARTTRLNAS